MLQVMHYPNSITVVQWSKISQLQFLVASQLLHFGLVRKLTKNLEKHECKKVDLEDHTDLLPKVGAEKFSA